MQAKVPGVQYQFIIQSASPNKKDNNGFWIII